VARERGSKRSGDGRQKGCRNGLARQIAAKCPVPQPAALPDLTAITGLKSHDLSYALIHTLAGSTWLSQDASEATRNASMKAALDAFREIAPRDEIEAMLAAQMIAVHNASMECFRRAMIPEQPLPARDANLKHATKLSRTYATQMEALNKHRGKGQQHMTVKHVHVHDGGQAIVGPVAKGAEGDGRN